MSLKHLPAINRFLLILTAACFGVTVFAVALEAGLANTPFETRDGSGRPLGFNDPISKSHIGIILQNVRLEYLLSPGPLYLLFQVFIIAYAGWQLISASRSSRRGTRWLLLLQPALFPVGILGWFSVPQLLRELAAGKLDREAFIDGFAAFILAQSLWVAVALMASLVLPGESLGLRNAFQRAWRWTIRGVRS